MSSRISLSQRRFRGTQHGYSLVELAISLAIIAAVIVGSLIGVQRILANNRANTVLSEVPRVTAAVLGIAANGSSLGNLNTAQAAALGVFSPESVTGPANAPVVTNAFGGNYLVQGVNVAIGTVPAGRSFVIRVTGVPLSMCGTMASSLASLARGIWVDNTAAETTITAAPDPKVAVKDAALPNAPIALDKLATSCGSAGAGDSGVRTVNALFGTV